MSYNYLITENIIIPYKGRSVDYRKPVSVYRNLRGSGNSKYSIKQESRVCGHTNSLTLYNCTLTVSSTGRQRVLRERQKNVHANVKGWVYLTKRCLVHNTKVISYNPYKNKFFQQRSISARTSKTKSIHASQLITFSNQGVQAHSHYIKQKNLA